MKKTICFFLAIIFLQNIAYNQNTMLYFNGDNGNTFIGNNTDFKSASQSFKNNSFKKVYDIGGNKLLFYNEETGAAQMVDNATLQPVKEMSYISSGWTSIVKMTDNRILFYNRNNGSATVTNNVDYGTISQPAFSGWTHIISLRNAKLAFYNNQTGLTLITDMNFASLSQALTLETGFTQLTDLGNGNFLLYNSASGSSSVADEATLKIVKKPAFSAGWTNIVNAGNNKILFYNANNGVSVNLDYALDNQVSVNTLEKCTDIIAYNIPQSKSPKFGGSKMENAGSIPDMSKMLIGQISFKQTLANNKSLRVVFEKIKMNENQTDFYSGKNFKSSFSERSNLIQGTKDLNNIKLKLNSTLRRTVIAPRGPSNNIDEDYDAFNIPPPGEPFKNNETSDGQYCVSGTQTIDFTSDNFSVIGSNYYSRFSVGLIYSLSSLGDKFTTQAYNDSRTPINLYCDALGTSYQINNPSASNANEINNAVFNMRNSITSTPNAIDFNKLEEVKTQAEFYTKITGGGKCSFGTIDAMISSNSSENTFKFYYDFQNPMFTISATPPTGNVFFTDATINADANKINDGAFLKEITYGRRLIISIEATKSISDLKTNIKATFKSLLASGYANMDHQSKKLLQSSKITVLVLGGNLDKGSALTFTDFDKLRQCIMDYQSDRSAKSAIPLSYSFSDLQGNYIATHVVDAKKQPYSSCFNPNSKIRVRCLKMIGNSNTLDLFGYAAIQCFNKDGVEINDIENKSIKHGFEFSEKSKFNVAVNETKDFSNDINKSRAFAINLFEAGKLRFQVDYTDWRTLGNDYYKSAGGFGVNTTTPATINLPFMAGGTDGLVNAIAKTKDGVFVKRFSFRSKDGKDLTFEYEFSLID